MSANRWKKLPPIRQDKFGYYLCRLCMNPCPGTERQWCSEYCLRQYLTMASGSVVRAQLYERDHGICSMCGVIAAQMDAALQSLKSDVLHPLLMTIHPMIITTLRADGWSNIKRRGRGSYPDAITFTSCWEADHIKPVVAGGGECGIDNYRTLCFVCHKKASAEQARARARARRLKKHASHISTNLLDIAKVPSVPDRPDDTIPF